MRWCVLSAWSKEHRCDFHKMWAFCPQLDPASFVYLGLLSGQRASLHFYVFPCSYAMTCIKWLHMFQLNWYKMPPQFHLNRLTLLFQGIWWVWVTQAALASSAITKKLNGLINRKFWRPNVQDHGINRVGFSWGFPLCLIDSYLFPDS